MTLEERLWIVHLWIDALRDSISENNIERIKSCQRNLRKDFNKFKKEFEESSTKPEGEDTI